MPYATRFPNGLPVYNTIHNPVLAENRPTFNVVTLLRILLESKARPSALPTYAPNKVPVDLLLETYAKSAHLIVYDSPSFSTAEQINQSVRESLRQKVRDATGIAIPGTTGYDLYLQYVPIRHENDVLAPVDSDLPYYVVEAEAIEILPTGSSLLPVQTDIKGKLPKKVSPSQIKSVAGATANWLSQVNNFLKSHVYKRAPDLLTSEMRILDFSINRNQRNPQLFPHIVILCTADLAMVLDIFVNNTRMDVFHYANRGLNQVTAPVSVKDTTFSGLLTVQEFGQYNLGLALALLAIRHVVQGARITARKTKVLPEIRI
jgi:hypothetical protein